MTHKPIVITQECSGWVTRKGKTILACNYATGKYRWSPESRITIDDTVWYKDLADIDYILSMMKR